MMLVTSSLLLVFGRGHRENVPLGWIDDEASCEEETYAVMVRGDSMEPLIADGKTITVSSGYYRCHEIGRGDVVIVEYPRRERGIVKRVRGIPGDRLEIVETGPGMFGLRMNGESLMNSGGESYALSDEQVRRIRNDLRETDGIIRDRYYLVLGESPTGSLDSTVTGLFFEGWIVGKAVLP